MGQEKQKIQPGLKFVLGWAPTSVCLWILFTLSRAYAQVGLPLVAVRLVAVVFSLML